MGTTFHVKYHYQQPGPRREPDADPRRSRADLSGSPPPHIQASLTDILTDRSEPLVTTPSNTAQTSMPAQAVSRSSRRHARHTLRREGEGGGRLADTMPDDTLAAAPPTRRPDLAEISLVRDHLAENPRSPHRDLRARDHLAEISAPEITSPRSPRPRSPRLRSPPRTKRAGRTRSPEIAGRTSH